MDSLIYFRRNVALVLYIEESCWAGLHVLHFSLLAVLASVYNIGKAFNQGSLRISSGEKHTLHGRRLGLSLGGKS